jgi:hypothetical protein
MSLQEAAVAGLQQGLAEKPLVETMRLPMLRRSKDKLDSRLGVET